MVDKQPPVLFLMGATASGKTDLASHLFDLFPCELISVDSAQVYKQMNIGTAKPDAAFLKKYPHHLIDIRSVNDFYSVAEFCRDAKKIIKQIIRRGKLPVLVGGTMFYFSALQNGLSDLPATDANVRKRIQQKIDKYGLSTMHDVLSKIDPEMSNKIIRGDRQRLQRALEIADITQQPPSSLMCAASNNALPNPIIKIGLFTNNRALLHERIKQRFHVMIGQGLIEEVEELIKNYANIDTLSSMRTVGYYQCLGYIRGKLSAGEWIEKGIAATRQLAKRQLTWLRNQNDVVWIDSTQVDCFKTVEKYLKSCPQLM